MAYYVEQAVLALGVKIVFAEVEDFDNSTDSPEWEAQREERLAKLIDCWTGKDLHADPMLEGFHILHDHAQRLVEEITRYAGGSGRVVMPQTK